VAQGGYFAPGYARMLVFALGGSAKLPPNQPYTPPPLNPTERNGGPFYPAAPPALVPAQLTAGLIAAINL